MRDLKRLEEVVRSLFRIGPPRDALAVLGGNQTILRSLPEEYHEAAASLAERAREQPTGKDSGQIAMWL